MNTQTLTLKRIALGGLGISLTMGMLMVLIFGGVISTVSPQPNPPPKIIAILDDDVDGIRTSIELFSIYMTNVTFVHFLTCEQLTATIPATRYAAYILDYNLGDGIRGTWCIPKIKALHPDALIIGRSLVNGENQQHVIQEFQDAGAKFVNKIDGIETQADFLKTLLGK